MDEQKAEKAQVGRGVLTDHEVGWLREGHRDAFGNQVERVERIVGAHMAQAWSEGWQAGMTDGHFPATPNPYRDAAHRVITDRLAEALAVVKRACDIECKSPGKHTGCSSHEPYRALLAALSDNPTPPDGEKPCRYDHEA